MSMERRNHARIAHTLLNHIPVTVTFSGEARGTGTLDDLSTGGCKIQTRTTPSPGASIALKLAVSYKTESVTIHAALVGWTIKDQYFGVKFLEVKSTERLALDTYIASLGQLAPPTLF
jgi:c-di-GMP-binding flagellar brake protein YcgR